MFYRGKDAAVVFWMIEGEVTGVLVGRLVYEGTRPFAELVDPAARKLPLIRENLQLLEEGAAGRPPIYYHRGFVIAPA